MRMPALSSARAPRAARIAAPAAGNPAQLPAATTRTGIDFAAGVPLVRSW